MRGDDGRMYAWGNDLPTPERAAFGRPLKTGATDERRDAPRGGAARMVMTIFAGDVWEWVEDEYDSVRVSARHRPNRGVTRERAPRILQTQDELRSKDQQGFTGSNPIPARVRACPSRRRVQLRRERSTRDEPRSTTRRISSWCDGRLPLRTRLKEKGRCASPRRRPFFRT